MNRRTFDTLCKKRDKMLMQEDREICVRILQNVLGLVSDRLANADRQIEMQSHEIQRLQEEVQLLSGAEEDDSQ